MTYKKTPINHVIEGFKSAKVPLAGSLEENDVIGTEYRATVGWLQDKIRKGVLDRSKRNKVADGLELAGCLSRGYLTDLKLLAALDQSLALQPAIAATATPEPVNADLDEIAEGEVQAIGAAGDPETSETDVVLCGDPAQVD